MHTLSRILCLLRRNHNLSHLALLHIGRTTPEMTHLTLSRLSWWKPRAGHSILAFMRACIGLRLQPQASCRSREPVGMKRRGYTFAPYSRILRIYTYLANSDIAYHKRHRSQDLLISCHSTKKTPRVSTTLQSGPEQVCRIGFTASGS